MKFFDLTKCTARFKPHSLYRHEENVIWLTLTQSALSLKTEMVQIGISDTNNDNHLNIFNSINTH